MNAQEFSAVAIFCESVRDEVGGTATLVGVYNDNIIVPAVPGMLGRLCVYVRMAFNPERKPENISISLKYGDGPILIENLFSDDLIKMSFEDSNREGAAVATLIARLEASPFLVESADILRAFVTKNGKTQVIGSLKIKVETEATA